MEVVTDPFELQRFVDAQNPVYEQVCRDLVHLSTTARVGA
jgi:uncharacterized protein (DUF1810 family)